MKTTFPSIRKSRNPAIGGFLILLPLVCFGLAPMAQAVGPDTDGAIPGSNNGDGIGVLVSRTTGIWNTGAGYQALNHLTSGNQNTATGLRALNNDTNGGYNTATGVYSLFSNASGFFNVSTGAYSLANNTTGLHNTAHGYAALFRNADGTDNTAAGFAALYHNTTAAFNCAFGEFALFNNLKAQTNNAFGVEALYSNLTGETNNAFGVGALFANTEGESNNGFGHDALLNNVTGVWNNAFGYQALDSNVSGSNNTAIGDSAGFDVDGSNNICIGAEVFGTAGESDAIHIGDSADPSFLTTSCFIGGIFGQTAAGGSAVFIDANGQLGTLTSSARFKDEIKPMDKASESILALKPVTFRYKKEIDAKGIPQFGLVAEEVAKVNPDLVVPGRDGKPYTVRYEAVNAMLLNEFLKEHQQVAEQKATIAELKSTVAQQQKGMDVLTAQLKEQATQIQKVSAQIEMSRPVPKVVLNNQ
jgi:uncharacterized coiled-coil protein SlyX